MCEIVIAHRKPKNVLHTRTSQVSTKWVRTRTSQLATAHRNLQLAIAHRKSCLAKYHKFGNNFLVDFGHAKGKEPLTQEITR